MELSDLQKAIMEQAERKGFGTKLKDINVAEKIALIHSEVSEAYEAWRKKNLDGKDGFKEELADIIIRVMHLGGVAGADIEKEIIAKIKFNEDRIWEWNKLNEKHS